MEDLPVWREANTFDSSNLTLALSATYARHRYAFTRAAAQGESIAAGKDVDTAPRTLGNARLAWAPSERLTAELEWVHLGSYFLDAENRHRYPGHELVNLRAAWRMGTPWRIAARLTNLTDQAYADRADFAFGDFRYFPGRDRGLYIEIGYTDD
ncbi:hypothetical protein BH24PSE2_BH24PSE2_17990 [soil metagenome]